MKTGEKIFWILSMATMLLQSCIFINIEKVRGNKNIVHRDIDISDYAEIYFSVPGEIIYRQTQDKMPCLQIITDENILPLLEIESTNNSPVPPVSIYFITKRIWKLLFNI